jgi:PPM family protein phosphatase
MIVTPLLAKAAFEAVGITAPKPNKKRTGDHHLAVAVEDFSGTYLLLAVADGVSSCGFDATASELTVQFLHQHFSEGQADLAERLTRAVIATNQDVFDAAPDGKAYQSTLVALAIDATTGHAYVVNVGDSRLYARNKLGQWLLLTKDDSENIVLRMKESDRQQHYSLKTREVLTRCIGGDYHLKVNAFPVRLQDYHAILLCSDGWSKLSDFETVTERAYQSVDMLKSLEASFSSMQAFFHDDTTVVLLRQLQVPDEDDGKLLELISASEDYAHHYTAVAMIQLIYPALEKAIFEQEHDTAQHLLDYIEKYRLLADKSTCIALMNLMAKHQSKLLQRMGLLVRRLG